MRPASRTKNRTAKRLPAVVIVIAMFLLSTGRAWAVDGSLDEPEDLLRPPAPPSLSAEPVDAHTVSLHWPDVDGETRYRVDRSIEQATWTAIGSTRANVTSYADTGLYASTTYLYRVRAGNEAGTSPSSPLALVVTPTQITRIGTSFAEDYQSGRNTFTVARPDGVQSGDVLVALILALYTQPSHPLDAPEGWTKIDQVVHAGRYFRVAISDEPASYTWTFTESVVRQWTGVVVAYRGVDQVQPVGGAASWPSCQGPSDWLCNGGSGNVIHAACVEAGCPEVSAPSVDAESEDGLELGAYFVHDEAYPLTLPPGYAQLLHQLSGIVALAIAERNPAPSGSTGEVAVVPDAGSSWVHGIGTMLWLRPASGDRGEERPSR